MPTQRQLALENIDGLLPIERTRYFGGIPDQTEAVKTLREVLEAKAGIVVLASGPGAGKTWLLHAMVNAMRNLDYPAMYRTGAKLLQELRDTYDDNGATFERVMRRFNEVPCLAIDEFDKTAKPTEWATTQMHVLVDERWRRRASTITLIATNAQPTDFNKVFPSAIVDRLFDRANRFVVLAGGSKRR